MRTTLRRAIVISLLGPVSLHALSVGLRAQEKPKNPPTSASAGKPTNAASTQPNSGANPTNRKDRLVTEMNDYYARLYGQPLTQKPRFPRLIAVASLARIDGPPLTKALLGVVGDGDVVVSQLAWEALHSRHSSLTADERIQWLDAGMATATKGGFPGQTAAPLLNAIAERPPMALKGLPDLLNRVATENNPESAEGRLALDAARNAVAAWQEPKIIRGLLSRMTAKPQLFAAYAHMLGGLPGAPDLSFDAAAAAKAAWTKYQRDAKWTPPTTLPAYMGVATVFPPAERIENPEDPKWRKDLELPSLKLERVEIAYCIDATPSMEISNPYVAGYLETNARLFNLVQYNVRSGVVYYRHEINPAIQDDCCKKWQTHKDDFAVKTMALTDRPADLVAQMRDMKIGGRGTGHAGNGAYCAGVETAMKDLAWTPNSRRVIAMTGDARVTPGSDQALIDISRKAKGDGYSLVYLARDKTAAKAVEAASEAAMGMRPILYGDDIKRADSNSAAGDNFHQSAFEEMAVRVLQQSLPAGYRDRVRPVIDALTPIMHANLVATKQE